MYDLLYPFSKGSSPCFRKQGLDMFYGFGGRGFPVSVLGAADLAANVLVVFCDRRDGRL